jgi:hypothetical protein
MATSKMTRDFAVSASQTVEEDSSFDFGEPEVIAVELSPGKFLTLKEPSANDLIEISKISSNKNLDEIEITVQTICILHAPDAGQRKLPLKDAKRLTARQLKKLGKAINELLGIDFKDGENDAEEDTSGE